LIGDCKAKRQAPVVLCLLTGVWFYRFALAIEPFVAADDRTFVRQIASLIQTIIDGGSDLRS
jgi:hypothetical protein